MTYVWQHFSLRSSRRVPALSFLATEAEIVVLGRTRPDCLAPSTQPPDKSSAAALLFTHVSIECCSPFSTIPLWFFGIHHLPRCIFFFVVITHPVSRPRRNIIINRNKCLTIRTSIVNNLFDRLWLSIFYSPSPNFRTLSSTVYQF